MTRKNQKAKIVTVSERQLVVLKLDEGFVVTDKLATTQGGYTSEEDMTKKLTEMFNNDLKQLFATMKETTEERVIYIQIAEPLKQKESEPVKN